MLDRKTILGKDDKHVMKLEIPEWDGFVYVKSMSLGERILLNDKWKGSENLGCALAVECVCDENGKNLFQPEDCDLLLSKNAGAMSRIMAAALELNGFNAKVEEVKKN